MKELYPLHRVKCVRWCVFFVFYMNKHGNIVLEQELREIFGVKKHGVAGDDQNCTVRKCLILYWSLNDGGW